MTFSPIILYHWPGEVATVNICQLSNPLLFFAVSDESFGGFLSDNISENRGLDTFKLNFQSIQYHIQRLSSGTVAVC